MQFHLDLWHALLPVLCPASVFPFTLQAGALRLTALLGTTWDIPFPVSGSQSWCKRISSPTLTQCSNQYPAVQSPVPLTDSSLLRHQPELFADSSDSWEVLSESEAKFILLLRLPTDLTSIPL